MGGGGGCGWGVGVLGVDVENTDLLQEDKKLSEVETIQRQEDSVVVVERQED